MGRTKTKKNVILTAKSNKASSSKPQGPSVAALLEKAQILIVQCDYELAHRFITRILEQDEYHPEAREMLGFVEIERGELENAKAAFTSLIPPSPHASSPPPAAAYLYLAQLTEDDPRTALALYQAGLDILVTRLKNQSSNTTEQGNKGDKETREMVVRTIIGMVEIWMSDLCFEDDAEEQCTSLLNVALETDPQNVEALHCLGSVRMSQQRPAEALELAYRAWAPWKNLQSDDISLPPLAGRLSLTRLFIELSQFTSALIILQGIMASDDQDVEAWYLEGWCFYLMGQQKKEGRSLDGAEDLSWEDLHRDARDCLETCKTLHESLDHPDDQILSHTKELIQELEANGITPSPEGEEPDGVDEDDWDDVDDDEGEDVNMAS